MTDRSPGRVRRTIAAACLATSLMAVTASPALAAPQSPTVNQQKEACEKAGGSWRPRGGGYGCRINVGYGCGVDILVGPDGKVTGLDYWCFDYQGSIGKMTPVAR